MKNSYLEVGKIQNTHGIKGDLKVEFWCDDYETFSLLKTVYMKDKNGYLPLEITRNVPFKDLALIRVRGVESPEEGASYKGRILYAKREDISIEEGSFFIADLIGLPVYDIDKGTVYGKLKDVDEGAASQLYEIETKKGLSYLPVVPEFVIDIDLEKGIGIRPIEGIFDED